VAELAARKVRIDSRAIELEPCWKALDDRDEAGSMGLAGSGEAKGSHLPEG
jgi:hypothetical protein